MSLPTLLLTGHTGFVGHTVLDLSGVNFADGWRIATLPNHFDIRSNVLVDVIASIRPDAVLHLAALTSVVDSFRDPQTFFGVNFHGTWNLLSALRAIGFRGRLLYVSSGDCYGAVPDEALPIQETQPLRPRSPYAMTKVAAEALCYQWSQSEGLDLIIARPFNHIGPGQDDRFAVASFAKQIARIAADMDAPRIAVGNLDITRDFTDVRDVVSAYLKLFSHGHCAEAYNVGSGVEVSARHVLARLISIAGVDVDVVIDPARMRPDEQRRAVADVSKIARDTEWRATIPLDRTLTDTLQYWKKRITNG